MLAQHLRHREDEVGRGRAGGQLAVHAEADDLGREQVERLPEQHRLGLDAADAPAEHAEAVHHRRVRVGADERVGERDAVAVVDDAREVLEVHLVADPRPRRDDLEVRERVLAPAQEEVALAVALHLELDVALERDTRRERVDLHRVVDHELGRDQRVDLLGIAAEVGHRVPHRREVDDGGHARQVLQEDPRGRERDLVRGLGLRVPARHRLDVGLVAVPQDILQQHAERVRQARDVIRRLKLIESEDLVRAISDGELRGRGHRPRFKQNPLGRRRRCAPA